MRLHPSELGFHLSIAERANQPERAAFAKQHADALAPDLSTLTLVAPRGTAQFVVTLDGTTLTSATIGLPVPVDPGDHPIVVSAPKKKSWSSTLVLGKSEAKRFEIPDLEDAPEPPATVLAAPPPPCEEGDASCGRGYRSKKLFIQVRVGGALNGGGFLGTRPTSPSGSGGTNYAGASYTLGGGFEAGLSFLFGLERFPAGVPGFFSSILVEPLLGWFGAATVGAFPTTNETAASGDFFFRVGTTVGYQLLWLGSLDPTSRNQHGVGFMVGYRPGAQYAFAQGAFYERDFQFTHGPVASLMLPRYFARGVELVRAFVEVGFFHVPVTSAYFVTIGGGAAFP